MSPEPNEQPRTWKNAHALGASLILLVCACFPGLAASQEQPPEPEQLLTKYFGFSRDQVVQIQQGAAIVKILKPPKHEIAVVAAVRFNVPVDFFVARFHDIERHKKSGSVLQVRKLSDPPQAEDFAGLTLLPQDLQDLKGCQPGQCQVKLSRSQIEVIQRLDFAAPEAGEQATALMRSLLADYARANSAGGNQAMVVYEDKGNPAASGTQFAELLGESSYLVEYAPEFLDYLRSLPEKTPLSVDRFLYWSKENYGHDLKAIVSITDAIVYQQAAGRVPPVLLASKQIYANHYFESSLGLTMLFGPMEGDPSPSFYIVYVNRSRIDLLRKWYSVFARGRISDSGASSMRKGVLELKNKIEAEYATAQAAGSAANNSRRSARR